MSVFHDFSPGPLMRVEVRGIPVLIKRLDLVRSWASGNKYYKLKGHISEAIAKDIPVIVSKGGMFSNHLAALANACRKFEIHCICMIRSHGADEMNPSIQRLRENNAEIVFLSPREYAECTSDIVARNYPEALFIEEGGADPSGIQGASDIFHELQHEMPATIILAGGTMSTAAGIISAATTDTKIIIVPAWKGSSRDYVEDLLNKYSVHPLCKYEVWPEYHFGGFGKYADALIECMHVFTSKTQIPLDPVYTGKLMYAVSDKISSGYFIPGEKIIVLHTGGLQGIEGFAYRFPHDWSKYLELVSSFHPEGLA